MAHERQHRGSEASRMARRKRRDCRVGLRKKAEKNARRDEQIREIQKVRKGKPAAKRTKEQAGMVAAEEGPGTDPSSVAPPAMEFLQRMRTHVKAEGDAVRQRLQARSSDAIERTSGAAQVRGAKAGSE